MGMVRLLPLFGREKKSKKIEKKMHFFVECIGIFRIFVLGIKELQSYLNLSVLN